MPLLRAAVIGTGSFAAEHVRALRMYPERVTLIAAASPDARDGARFCADHAIPTHYTDARALLSAEKPDIVHIVTPPHTHVELALACLAAGAHVLCEKPLCATLADWDRLDEAARRAGRTVSTVFQWRFGAAAQHLKRLIGAGSLGALHVGLCATLWYRDAAYYAVEWRARRDSAFGGVGMAMGIHLMDLLLWLCPAWTGVQAWTATRPVPHMQPGALDVENLALAHIHFADGSLVSAINSAVSPRQTTLLRLDFARATVEVSALYRAANADWTFTPVDPADVGLWTPADAREDGVGDLAAQVGALLDSLARGEPPLVTGAESRRIVEFLTCLYASARTGTPVTRGSLHS